MAAMEILKKWYRSTTDATSSINLTFVGMETTSTKRRVFSAVAGLLPLASVSQQPYVYELLSFTIDRLHKEPQLLQVDAERIKRQMQEVAVGITQHLLINMSVRTTFPYPFILWEGVGDDDNWASVVDNGADERLLNGGGGGGGESDASVGKMKGKSLKQASYFSNESSEDD